MEIITKGVLIGLLLCGLAVVAMALVRWCWAKLWERLLGYRGDHAA